MADLNRWRPSLGRFDLTPDQAAPEAIDQAIRSGVVFRGTNLWLLIFAIAIASVGLNVNSTAVIIGAMLVSPLMGPIMGVGYGAAVADFTLVRLATWNLFIATVTSLVVSAAYFSITPLTAEHSELLARTSPTIWDVLIALFGGLAGIVGVTRREKSNVIPGVAIATALMPPLCTAGYGLSSFNLAYFVGAFYLFCINSVFIAAATFVMCRVMGLEEVSHADAATARRAHRWIALIVIGTALPSVVLAHRLVSEEIFATGAARFVAAAFPPESGTMVVARHVDFERRAIHLTVVGEAVSDARMAELEADLTAAGLDGVRLRIGQSQPQAVDLSTLRSDLVRDLYERTLARLTERDQEIAALRASMTTGVQSATEADKLETEVLVQFPELGRVRAMSRRRGDETELSILVAGGLPKVDRERLEAWLRVRTGAARVWVVEVGPDPEVEPAAPPVLPG